MTKTPMTPTSKPLTFDDARLKGWLEIEGDIVEDIEGNIGATIAHVMEPIHARTIAATPDLLRAAQAVIAGLDARMKAHAAAGKAVPIFIGFADLEIAVNKALGIEQ